MWDKSVKWDTTIRPKKGWFQIDFRELWRYRDLILLMVKRDFKVFYKQTILGPAWVVLQPLFTTLVFTVIFGNVARPAHRRHALLPFLHGGQHRLAVFFQLPDSDQQHLCAEQQALREGIFPADGDAGGHGDDQAH